MLANNAGHVPPGLLASGETAGRDCFWHPCFFNEKTLGNTRIHSVLRQRRLNEVRGEPGLGCLLSLLLRGEGESDRAIRSEAFYDALHCYKGPSLGTPYTLCCPYTLLAHYSEVAWAEEQGVQKYLFRVSVGLEDYGYTGGSFLCRTGRKCAR